jgi:mRNA interferase HicA
VKRGNFIRELFEAGCYLCRHGKRHDLYVNPSNSKQTPVPRHSELKDSLCQLIKKQLGIWERVNQEYLAAVREMSRGQEIREIDVTA